MVITHMSTPAFDWSKTEAPSWSEFASDVRSGLLRPGQKELHSKYFYDDLGTALFQAITVLPEYGLTRADARILSAHAGDVVAHFDADVLIGELGSGTGQKTRFILSAARERQSSVRYCPIDVSAAALQQCERELSGIAQVRPIEATYLPGVREAAQTRSHGERLVVLFLGSTLGNFELPCAREFLRDLRQSLETGDYLLVGADLVKPVDRLLLAYDDPTGVTAAFNRNILARVNRELAANFDVRNFEHEVRWNAEHSRIEMYLRSTRAQRVSVPGARCVVDFAAGETIWTESSHKYELSDLEQLSAENGFRIAAQWVDHEWPFVESLWVAI